MREYMDAAVILERAIAAFQATTGLRAEAHLAEHTGKGRPGAVVDVLAQERTYRFAAEIKAIDRFQTLGTIKAKELLTPYPQLLVAPYITEATAGQCRELHLPFIDEAGNAYLEAQGLFVYVTGKRRPDRMRTGPGFRALTPAGLKIIFALLTHPKTAGAAYREIAKVARVGLGTVGDVLADLEERGHLTPEKPGPRRLLDADRLMEEWVTHYPIKLRPKLAGRRFTAPTADWWRQQDLRRYHAWWGGEVAAEKLTGYLRPTRVTAYVEGKPERLILDNRLRPEVNGEIEILQAFWTPGEEREPTDIAHPLVVYADLMATADARNIETAKLIRDRYLVDPHRKG